MVHARIQPVQPQKSAITKVAFSAKPKQTPVSFGISAGQIGNIARTGGEVGARGLGSVLGGVLSVFGMASKFITTKLSQLSDLLVKGGRNLTGASLGPKLSNIFNRPIGQVVKENGTKILNKLG